MADWINARMNRCTYVPNKRAGEYISDFSATVHCEKSLIITFKVNIYYNNPVIYAYINMLIQRPA